MRYWVKLYTEIVNDPKMGRLTDRQFRTCINLFALAGEIDQDGALPDVEDLAWRLRLQNADLTADLTALAAVNILAATQTGWRISKWEERQAKAPSAAKEKVLQRVHEHRERERNESVTTLHHEVKRDVTPPEKNRIETEIEIPTPHISGNGNGRKEADRMQALNGKLGPELRRMLADEILKITGQLDLANTETDAGTAALYAAHEAAVAVHQMGYKTAEDLMTAEDDWYANDFRGKQQARPTIKWFLEQCAQTKAGKREVKPFAVEEWR